MASGFVSEGSFWLAAGFFRLAFSFSCSLTVSFFSAVPALTALSELVEPVADGPGEGFDAFFFFLRPLVLVFTGEAVVSNFFGDAEALVDGEPRLGFALGVPIVGFDLEAPMVGFVVVPPAGLGDPPSLGLGTGDTVGFAVGFGTVGALGDSGGALGAAGFLVEAAGFVGVLMDAGLETFAGLIFTGLFDFGERVGFFGVVGFIGLAGDAGAFGFLAAGLFFAATVGFLGLTLDKD